MIAVSTTVSAFVVLRHLATKPLWRDEAISLSVAGRPATRILSVLPHHDANAGLYYLLLHIWLTVGHSPAWARGFSAACFVATAALAAWSGWRWRGWEIGLACGLLVAVNPFLLYYGQEARPYALAVVLAAVATIALFWGGPGGTGRARGVFVGAAIALLYADLFAALYLIALVAPVVVARRRRHDAPLPGFTRRLGVIAAATAPLAVVMVGFERGQISWLARPDLATLTRTVTAMTGGGLGLAAVVALAIVALGASSRRRRSPTTVRGALRDVAGDRLLLLGLAAAAVLPPVVLWTVAQVEPVFIDRYVICSTVAMVGLTAAGLAWLRERPGAGGRLLAVAVLAVLVVLGGQRSSHLEAEPYKVDDGPGAVRFIQARAAPGDAVAYAGGGLRTLIDASRTRAPGPFPADVALAPGGQAVLQGDLYAREVSPAVLASRLSAVLRLWVITDPADQRYPQDGPFAQLKPLVTTRFGFPVTTSFGTIDVTLLVRES